MSRAIELARRAWNHTRPNPHVGCVIVRGGEVLGEGWHRRAGLPHAEVEALRAAAMFGRDVRGATAYVTLEPCNHQGRTGPCSEALVAAGITRVVVAQRDPNPVAGGGIERLRAAGVEVTTGVLAKQARLLNPAFNTRHLLGRPLVTLKWAISADGATSAHTGASRWITGGAARRHAHELRAEHEAIVVGIETALADGSRLTIRDADVPPGAPLRRIVLDRHMRLPAKHPVFGDTPEHVIVVGSRKAPVYREMALRHMGAEVWRLEAASDVDFIRQFVARLTAMGIQSLLVEGGRRVAGSFLAADIVDRVVAYVAPLVLGAGDGALGAVRLASPPADPSAGWRLHDPQWSVVGDDAIVCGWLRRHLLDDPA